MPRKLICMLVLILLVPVLFACPKKDEQGASLVQKASLPPAVKKTRLELKLKPGTTYQSMLHTMLDARIAIEAVDAKGKPVTSAMTSTTANNFQRTVTDGKITDGKMSSEMKTVGGVVDKTQSESGKAIRRTLILEGGKFRVNELGKPVEATSDEAALGEALGLGRQLLVTKGAKIEREGDAWAKLAKAQTSPIFPYIDTERLTELAIELPEKDVRVGDTWARMGQLQVGEATVSVDLTSTLQQVNDANGAKVAQVQVQLHSANTEPIALKGKSGGYAVSTSVDKLVLDGTITFVLDLNKGRVQTLMGDLQMSFGLNTILDKNGKQEKLRVKVDNAKMRITEDMLYDMPKGKP